MKNILQFPCKGLLVVSALMLMCIQGFSQKIVSDLTVVRSDTRAVRAEGANYNLMLKNNASISKTYKLVNDFSNTPCFKANAKIKNSNVKLKVEYLTKNWKTKIKPEIILRPGQSQEIVVRVNTIDKNVTNASSCMNVVAVSNSNGEKFSVLLKAFIPDPTTTE